MTLRNASGKFSLSGFGRKSNASDQGGTVTPNRVTSGSHNTASVYSSGDGDTLASPTGTGGGSGGGGGGAGHALDGLGRKIGKSIAHTSLLPSLGNQDLRQLQDVISSEKSVLTSAERLAVDMQTAASKLPPYGQLEGPDLQDVLSHSATLLSQVSVALRTFAQHESSMRQCFKRIREREERLDEMRRNRRTVGSKAESAERKLAKMGQENKQLAQQTELLQSLRNQMRQLDGDIVNEETKMADFKRQAVKEAMSFKFGGLEELGEKMCIVGELGKLLLEEIPLEETPPGCSRAPYHSYDRTENTVNEAVKCLATVQFHPSSAAPKPAPRPSTSTAPTFNQHSVTEHEQYEHLPGHLQSPPLSQVSQVSQAPQIPPINEFAYGGMENSQQPQLPHGQQTESHPAPRKFSAVSAEIIPPPNTNVVWNAPNDTDLDIPHYEFEQQRQMDAARAPMPDPQLPAQQQQTTETVLHAPRPMPLRRSPPMDVEYDASDDTPAGPTMIPPTSDQGGYSGAHDGPGGYHGVTAGVSDAGMPDAGMPASPTAGIPGAFGAVPAGVPTSPTGVPGGFQSGGFPREPSPPAQQPSIAAPHSDAGWQPLKATGAVSGMALHDGPARSSPPGSNSSPSLTLSQDAFAPLSESFLNPNDARVAAHRPGSANSGYYTAEEDRTSPAFVGAYPRASADSTGRADLATPTQATQDTDDLPPIPPIAPLNVPKRNSRPRPMSGYIPPASPPRDVSEEFAAPGQLDRDAAGYHNSRVSSSTFNVPRDVRAGGNTFMTPDSAGDRDSQPRDSYMTYATSNYPRDSYATFQSRNSLDDAVVVTIPQTPPRTATPTMHTPTGSNGFNLGTPKASGPTISAAAFRRGARRRSMNLDELEPVHQSPGKASDSSFGHTATSPIDGEPRRLPQLPTISPSAENILSVQGNQDAPPSYTPDTAGDSLR